MPHVPDFPTPSDDDDERESKRGGIVDRIIDDGNCPTVGVDALPGATPVR
uniref:Uncharacterized protein n=2 Tax=Haloterrigena alkaliphila TaxID=2816475 RepID=A0A8A2VHH3_9EURY